MATMNPPMVIPSDYKQGYEMARAVAPEMASNYIAHTTIGDPIAEVMTEDLAKFDMQDSQRFIQAAMDNAGDEALRGAPASLREFFAEADTPPDWFDPSAFAPGVRMFHRNSRTILVAFVAGVLIEGFTTNIAKSFFITGRVRDQGVRRLKQNNRHMIDIFLPGGLDRDGDGWKLSVRIRIVHARLRHLLNHSEEWDAEAWGEPISAAHLGYAISSFSARLLKHMKTLGAVYSDEEYESFMAVWRYSGYLMGIPETILFRDADEALKMYDVGLMCEPNTEIESIVMAHSLINSAPLIAGMTEPAARRQLAQYAYRLSRVIIGTELADDLLFPSNRSVLDSLGIVRSFRMRERYNHVLDKMIPGRARGSSFNRFSTLLETSVFDEAGISYRLPDHVYAEESSKW